MLTLLHLAAILGSPQVDSNAQFAFRPPGCTYSVQFPAAFSTSGNREASEADLALSDLRLSAVCLGTDDRTPPDTTDAASRLMTLAATMGLQDVEISTLPDPDCAQAHGTFPNGGAYEIVARACFKPTFTFIAEAVFRNEGGREIEKQFLDSLSSN